MMSIYFIFNSQPKDWSCRWVFLFTTQNLTATWSSDSVLHLYSTGILRSSRLWYNQQFQYHLPLSTVSFGNRVVVIVIIVVLVISSILCHLNLLFASLSVSLSRLDESQITKEQYSDWLTILNLTQHQWLMIALHSSVFHPPPSEVISNESSRRPITLALSLCPLMASLLYPHRDDKGNVCKDGEWFDEGTWCYQ